MNEASRGANAVASPLPLDRLVCPACRSALGSKGELLQCRSCGEEFPVVGGIPVLISSTMADSGIESVAELYRHVAGHYDQVFAPHIVEHYLRKRASLVSQLLPAGEIIDVGCGTGVLGARLAAIGYRVSGVDLSPAMLAEARSRGLGDVYAALSTALPFRDECFDLAISVATLHHLETPERVAATVAEMGRVVRRGGLVVVWDHNPLNPYWPFLMRRVPQDTGEERLVPLGELLEALAAAGLKVLSARQRGLVPDFLPAALLGPWRLLERLVEAIPVVRLLAAHNVVIAQRP